MLRQQLSKYVKQEKIQLLNVIIIWIGRAVAVHVLFFYALSELWVKCIWPNDNVACIRLLVISTWLQVNCIWQRTVVICVWPRLLWYVFWSNEYSALLKGFVHFSFSHVFLWKTCIFLKIAKNSFFEVELSSLAQNVQSCSIFMIFY